MIRLKKQYGGFNSPADFQEDTTQRNYKTDFYSRSDEPIQTRLGQNGEGDNSVYGGGAANPMLSALFQRGYGQQPVAEEVAPEQTQEVKSAVDDTTSTLAEDDPNKNNNLTPYSEGFNERINYEVNGSMYSPQQEAEMETMRNQIATLQQEQSNFLALMATIGMGEDEDEETTTGPGGYSYVAPATGGVMAPGTITPAPVASPTPAGTPVATRNKPAPSGGASSGDFAANIAKSETGGDMSMKYHYPNNPNATTKGPLGFVKGGHLHDYFYGKGYFSSANTQRYRAKYGDDYNQFWKELDKNPEFAAEVNRDYANTILQLSGNNPARAAAFNLQGGQGWKNFDARNYDARIGNNMSLRGYVKRAGYGNYLMQGGGPVPVLRSLKDKYIGLNNPIIGDTVIIANEGYNLYRGTDDGKPVELKDVVGKSSTLHGPDDTVWLYGDVFESRK